MSKAKHEHSPAFCDSGQFFDPIGHVYRFQLTSHSESATILMNRKTLFGTA